MFHVGSAFAGRPLVEDLGASEDTQRFRAQARDGTNRYLVLTPHRDERTMSRLRRAQRVSASHSGIATIEDILEHSLTLAIVSEWPAMGSLKDRCRRQRPMNGQDALEIILPVLDALRALHSGALVHGSIDVDTIRFRDGMPSSATLCGFGAIGAGSGLIPRPPEISKGSRTTPATDVFSVCSILDWMVRNPETDEVPRELRHILERGTRAMAAARFINAEDLHDALVSAAVEHTDAVPIFPEEVRDDDTSEADEATTPEPGIPMGGFEGDGWDEEWIEDSASMLSVTGEPYDESMSLPSLRPPKRPARPAPPKPIEPLRRMVTMPTDDGEEAPPPSTRVPILVGVAAASVAVAAIAMTLSWSDKQNPALAVAGPDGAVVELVSTRGNPRYAMARLSHQTGTVGSPESEPSRDADEATLEVRVPTFELGAYEVTLEQWRRVMNSDPVVDYHGVPERDGAPQPCAQFGSQPDMPVTCVTWLDAIRFANELSERHKLQPAYRIEGSSVTWDRSSIGFRLPTEAEWELAARQGDTGAHGPYTTEALCGFGVFANRAALHAMSHLTPEERVPCSSDDVGLRPIGSKIGGRNGVYDMLGNVSEWTWDAYSSAGVQPYEDTTFDGTAERVVRGSHWASELADTRLAHREGTKPSTRSYLVGFRLARGAYALPQ